MFELTHTVCLNCCREETWKMSWYDFQRYTPHHRCCNNPVRTLFIEGDDGFYSKSVIFQVAIEQQNMLKERWTKNSKVNKHMKFRIIDDLMMMGFIDAQYFDWIWGYNIKYRWNDRTVIT